MLEAWNTICNYENKINFESIFSKANYHPRRGPTWQERFIFSQHEISSLLSVLGHKPSSQVCFDVILAIYVADVVYALLATSANSAIP